MGSFGRAYICEVVGLYILHKLEEKYGKERISLYRDGSLACFENASRPKIERIKKSLIKLFKNEFNLNIVSEINLKFVSFLDLTLHLSTGKDEPHNKPDNKPLYISVNSYRPPNIKKTFQKVIPKI